MTCLLRLTRACLKGGLTDFAYTDSRCECSYTRSHSNTRFSEDCTGDCLKNHCK